MRYPFVAFLVLIVLYSCGEKKVDLSGNSPVNEKDFVAAFKQIKPPFVVADTNVFKKGDSLQIGVKVFEQFLPDSVFKPLFSKEKKNIVNPVGSIKKDKELYLLANIVTGKKVHLYVFVFDDKTKFLGYKALITNNKNDGYSYMVEINREPTFTITATRILKEKNEEKFTKTGWAYFGTTKQFNIVVNESNEDASKMVPIINPIDTLPKKNKFSGNYVKNAKNYIALRDTKDPSKYLFFVHFEREEGSCVGELKGMLEMKTATNGIYIQNGDPCVIDFTFSGTELAMKEHGSCGNHRGITCYFDDIFIKKKEAPKKKTKG